MILLPYKETLNFIVGHNMDYSLAVGSTRRHWCRKQVVDKSLHLVKRQQLPGNYGNLLCHYSRKSIVQLLLCIKSLLHRCMQYLREEFYRRQSVKPRWNTLYRISIATKTRDIESQTQQICAQRVNGSTLLSFSCLLYFSYRTLTWALC